MKYLSALAALLMAVGVQPAQAETSKTVVLELFTSQGCSSCPPADALLHRLSNEDPNLLPLSFHVDYWDHLGWKDPFSSRANTDRQNNYAQSLGERQIFTPQMIVDGTQSVVGSQEHDVRRAIAQAEAANPQAMLQFAPASGGQMQVTVTPTAVLAADADIWIVHYNRLANTDVGAGENGGRKLQNINNVTSIERLGGLQQVAARFTFAKPDLAHEGIAVIVQQSRQGPVLGAAFLREDKTTL